MAAPGRIAISDPSAGNAMCQQNFALWKDDLNPYGTTATFQYLSAAPFFFNTVANGVELVSTFGNADVRADRPVTAKGEPLEIRSKNSLLVIAATKSPQRALLAASQPSVWMLLVCQVKWEPVAGKGDKVEVSFQFTPLPNQPAWQPANAPDGLDFIALAGGDADAGVAARSHTGANLFKRAVARSPDYGAIWEKSVAGLSADQFALLDVSTNADLLGVSFGSFGNQRMAMMKTMLPAGTGFPLQVKGMEVVSQGMNARAFTVPQISWEPVINLTPPPDPSTPPNPFDPSPKSINDPRSAPIIIRMTAGSRVSSTTARTRSRSRRFR